MNSTENSVCSPGEIEPVIEMTEEESLAGTDQKKPWESKLSWEDSQIKNIIKNYMGDFVEAIKRKKRDGHLNEFLDWETDALFKEIKIVMN